MKIRNGFVSNSSSSSFIITNGNNLTATQLSDMLKQAFPDFNCGWYVNEEIYDEDYSFREDVVIIDVQKYKTLAYRCLEKFTGFNHTVWDICDYRNKWERAYYEEDDIVFGEYISSPEKLNKYYADELEDYLDAYENYPERFHRLYNNYVDEENNPFKEKLEGDQLKESLLKIIKAITGSRLERIKRYREFNKNFHEKVESSPRIKSLKKALVFVEENNLNKEGAFDRSSSDILLSGIEADFSEVLKAVECEECIRSGCSICGKKYATLWDEIRHSGVVVITGENALPSEIHEFLINLAKENDTEQFCYVHLG